MPGDGVRPQLDVRGRQGKQPDAGEGHTVHGQQSHAQVCDDHVLHQVEAVGLMGQPGAEPRHGGEGADDVFVGGVAGVGDPLGRAEPGEDVRRGAGRDIETGGNTQAPLRRPQRCRPDGGVDGGRGQVVVVGQCQVRLVRGEKAEGFGGLVFTDQDPHLRVAGREAGDDGQQERADGGAESGDPQGAVGLRRGAQVETCGSTAARIVTACSASRRPAGVSRTRRPSGSMSAVPVSRARAAICWDTVEVVVLSASATARIDPSRDSSASISSRRVSISPLFRFPERNVHDRHVDINDALTVY